MNAAIHRAAVAPSIGRWSTERVKLMTVPTLNLPFRTTGLLNAPPTARIAD